MYAVKHHLYTSCTVPWIEMKNTFNVFKCYGFSNCHNLVFSSFNTAYRHNSFMNCIFFVLPINKVKGHKILGK
jgi:hypothetical protein